MSTFLVNGKSVTVNEDIKLINYLRDTLRLTSVKDGCGEGACGTCTVLIDGKALKACVQRTSRMEGKSVITVEGLTPREREVYAYAFAECGAVQCGFCIPGMVMSAKALLDANSSPTPAEVKQAIRNNICRCTGYVKIEQAILLAADIFKNGLAVPHTECKGLVGEHMQRVDAEGKTLGTLKYADDLYYDNMLYGSALRAKYPRARVVSIDTSKAKAAPGIVCVLTAEDIPGKQKIGHLKKDYDVLIPVGSITHFLGDAIALVAGETRETVEYAKSLIEVEYEELPCIHDPDEAMRHGAPPVHEHSENNLLVEEHLVRGNADARLAESAHVVTNTYKVPFTEHAFMETECAVACKEGDGVRVYSADQGIYQTRRECAEMLGLPDECVRVTAMMVGGGFGGKEDMSVQHHAALLTWKTGRPVKVKLTRAESILVHPKRHAMTMTFTTGCDESGRLTAMKAVLTADTGAYASLGGPVLQRACTHAAGPYNYQDIDILGRAIYTNNPPAGAFRGFGVTQSCFATECNLNQLAAMCGMSPFDFRYLNAIRPGQVLPNGQIADPSTALVETLDAVRDEYTAHPEAGIACAMKNSGLGVGIPDTGRCRIAVLGGRLHIHSSAACIGQGMGTVLTQMVCEITGFAPDIMIYEKPDTLTSPDSGNTTASRQTLHAGEAACRASHALMAALRTEGSLEALEGREFLGEYTSVTDKLGSDKPNPVSHVAYGYATHLVELEENGRLKKVVAAHDVGRAVNPRALSGQIEGGVVMSLGYALTEDFPLDNCRPTAKLGTLGLFKAPDVPEIVTAITGKNESSLACGAKGVGEICSIPTAPAVQLAYFNRDGVFRTELPLKGTPYSKES